MPCSAWPQNPREYAQSQMIKHRREAFFSGTVVLPDGTTVQVSVPIPEELAKQIAVLGVEYELFDQKRQKENERELQRMRDETQAKKHEAAVGQREQLQELQRAAMAQSELDKKAHIFGPSHGGANPFMPAPYKRSIVPSSGLPMMPAIPVADIAGRQGTDALKGFVVKKGKW